MDWAYVISAGIRGRVVVPAVAGLLFGHLLMIAIVVAGVGALLVGNPLALTALTLLGAAYLLWIGFNMLQHLRCPAPVKISVPIPWLRWAGKGVCVSGLNPKVFCCFGAAAAVYRRPGRMVGADADAGVGRRAFDQLRPVYLLVDSVRSRCCARARRPQRWWGASPARR